jgi:hypothetical protein
MGDKLIVKYDNERYRVICSNGSITHITHQFQTVDYVPGTLPGDEVINGISQLVEEYYLHNQINTEGRETIDLGK